MQTIRKWHWANRRARCWHVTTHNGKENGRNIRKWIEKMSAPCTCAPLYLDPSPTLSLWQGNLDWKQVENLLLCCPNWGQVAVCAVLCCVCVKVFWVICPHNRCEVLCTHTHTQVAAGTLFVLSGRTHELRRPQSITQTVPPFLSFPSL